MCKKNGGGVISGINGFGNNKKNVPPVNTKEMW